jgi:hypothetical protein
MKNGSRALFDGGSRTVEEARDTAILSMGSGGYGDGEHQRSNRKPNGFDHHDPLYVLKWPAVPGPWLDRGEIIPIADEKMKVG